MPDQAQIDAMVKECMKKKGYSKERCKRYIAGGIWNQEKMTQPTPSDVHVQSPSNKVSIKRKKKDNTFSLTSIPIFKAGSWKDGTAVFTIDDLDEIVKNTNALISTNLHEPPIKLGHNEQQDLLKADGLPAAGWVTKLCRIGDQIFADIDDVPKAVNDAIETRAYSKISAEIYQAFEHPETHENIGKVLRAVALLGADIPAVKGLGDISKLYHSESMFAITFSEKELQEANAMSKMWTLKEVQEYVPCCVEAVKIFMEEKKLEQINQDDLADIITSVKMKKFADANNCPPGFAWDETAKQCMKSGIAPADNPERHICPEGQTWDDATQACIDAMKKDDKPADVLPADKPAEPAKPVEPAVDEEFESFKKAVKEKKADMPDDEIKSMWDIMQDIKKKKVDEKPADNKLADVKVGDKNPAEWTPEETDAEVSEYKAKAKKEEIDAITADMADDAKRPPKGWFDSCVKSVAGKTDAPETLCGWVYANQMSPEAKAKAESTRQSEKESAEVLAAEKEKDDKIKELTERLLKSEHTKMKEFITKLRDENRQVLLPKFDAYIDKFVELFAEKTDVVKFADGDYKPLEIFAKFMKEIVESKVAIFKELAKAPDGKEPTFEVDDSEKQKLIQKYAENKPTTEVDGDSVDLHQFAEKIEKEQKISYKQALSIAHKAMLKQAGK